MPRRRGPYSSVKADRITLKHAQSQLRAIGISLSKNEYGEYRVNFKGGREETAYYTDDLYDAVSTGHHMLRRLNEIAN